LIVSERRLRVAAIALAVGCVALVTAASASAEFHLIKVREVTGDTVGGDQSYVELQMYAPGQNLVAGHDISVWDADAFQVGSPDGSINHHTLTGPNPPNGDNQRTILIGDTGVAGADFTISELSNYLEPHAGANLTQGGAICFESIPIDCVAWGQNFTGANNLPDKTTPNGSNMPTGLLALQRNIGANCPTLLEAADDTNNAQADFSLVGANPRPNSVTPTEVPCPGAGAGAGAGGGGFTSCAGKLTTLVGTDGRDTLRGTAAADVIAAGKGSDVVKGLAGNDTVCGGAGKDTLKGGKGKDKLRGEAGADTLKGGPGKDKLKGGPGKDVQIQ
jgi:Ca2+-binding RTX toxin-like protein